ncbi:response regulator [Chitinophaga sp. SYP-B3965]|uniref:ATP-binding response regulator n=1 Tax=Chitinophaga sp. SYP-B3965 TaxID=2663120 RepID=UPI00129981A5|nr:hybrid sensor histidine kinase/response regulator [Chitinophaga sp. SYP-B3965]MRG44151.1 response regulator [Chitinophaga sp. SYP-B3965]
MNPRDILKKVINAGAQTQDGTKARTVVIVNIMAAIPALFAFVLAPILFIITSQLRLLYCPVIEGLILITVPFFNRSGKYITAKFIMFCTHCAGTLFFGVIMGPAANVELIVIFLIGMSFLLFTDNRQRVFSLLAVFSVLTALGIYYGYEFTKLIVLIAVVTLNIMVFYFYSEHFKESIDKLMAKTKKLEDVNLTKSLSFNKTNHETRNHLNVVTSISEELLRQSKGADKIVIGADRVKALNIACKQMTLVINNVLDYSTMENGKFELLNSNFDLRELVEEITASFQVMADEKQVNIRTELAPGLPEIILSDERELTTVISNLISNAVKFTAPHSEIGIRVFPNEKGQLVITVGDAGPGLNDQERIQIFKPYVTQRHSTYRGTGLGLPLVKKTVEFMGGSIRVESKPGIGSIFIVTLPLVAGAKQLEEKISYKKFNKTVLVIDDNQMNLRAVEILLQRMGCHVLLSPDLFNGIEAASREKPDLVLLDIGLPGIYGKEALKVVQEALNGIPVISVTGESAPAIKEEMLAAGAVGFLSKPLIFDTFYSELEIFFTKK